MIARALSPNWIQIIVTEEAWQQSLVAHPDLELEDVVDAIDKPDNVYRGNDGRLYSVKKLTEGKYLIAIYTESPEGGEFLSAIFSTKARTPEMKELTF